MAPPATDILLLAHARGDATYGSTAWSIANHLAQYHRVFYLESPFTWKDHLTRSGDPVLQRRKEARKQQAVLSPLPDQAEQLQVLVPPAMMPTNFLPPGALYKKFQAWNQARFHRWLEQMMHIHQIRPQFALNIWHPFYSFPQFTPPLPRLYYCVDRIAATYYLQKHGPAWETERMQEMDGLLATSQWLAKHCAATNPAAPVLYLPNAADIGLFEQVLTESLPVPQAMAQHPDAVHLLYQGSIEHRIDTELIEAIITQRPDWQWWWVGPAQDFVKAALQPFAQCHFVGSVKQWELPPWLQHCQVGIIPFRQMDFTEAIYPLKVHEYQAAGMPVVSSPFSPDIEAMAGTIRLASDASSWIEQIEDALRTDSPEQRTARSEATAAHSWTARSQQLLAWVNEQKRRKT